METFLLLLLPLGGRIRAFVKAVKKVTGGRITGTDEELIPPREAPGVDAIAARDVARLQVYQTLVFKGTGAVRRVGANERDGPLIILVIQCTRSVFSLCLGEARPVARKGIVVRLATTTQPIAAPRRASIEPRPRHGLVADDE